MRWLLNLGYLVAGAIVVAVGIAVCLALSAVISAVGLIALVGGAIFLAALLIKEYFEGRG